MNKKFKLMIIFTYCATMLLSSCGKSKNSNSSDNSKDVADTFSRSEVLVLDESIDEIEDFSNTSQPAIDYNLDELDGDIINTLKIVDQDGAELKNNVFFSDKTAEINYIATTETDQEYRFYFIGDNKTDDASIAVQANIIFNDNVYYTSDFFTDYIYPETENQLFYIKCRKNNMEKIFDGFSSLSISFEIRHKFDDENISDNFTVYSPAYNIIYNEKGYTHKDLSETLIYSDENIAISVINSEVKYDTPYINFWVENKSNNFISLRSGEFKHPDDSDTSISVLSSFPAQTSGYISCMSYKYAEGVDFSDLSKIQMSFTVVQYSSRDGDSIDRYETDLVSLDGK